MASVTSFGNIQRLSYPHRQTIRNRVAKYRFMSENITHNVSISLNIAEKEYEEALLKVYILHTNYNKYLPEIFWKNEWKNQVYKAYHNAADKEVIFDIVRLKAKVI